MPEPTTWTFMSFVTDTGRDVAKEWDTDQSFEAELALRTMIKDHRKISDHLQWTSWRHAMDGKAGKAGVVELGFKAEGKSYRVLCKFNGRKCIVLLCMCYHKGRVWTPPDSVNTATERAQAVSAGRARLNVIQIEDDI